MIIEIILAYSLVGVLLFGAFSSYYGAIAEMHVDLFLKELGFPPLYGVDMETFFRSKNAGFCAAFTGFTWLFYPVVSVLSLLLGRKLRKHALLRIEAQQRNRPPL